MKRLFSLVLIVAILLSLNVSAAGNIHRSATSTPLLTFYGTTANCKAVVRDSRKSISVTMELWHGKTLLESWTGSGTGSVSMERRYSGVKRGETYTLKVYGTSGGVAFTAPSTSRTA